MVRQPLLDLGGMRAMSDVRGERKSYQKESLTKDSSSMEAGQNRFPPRFVQKARDAS